MTVVPFGYGQLHGGPPIIFRIAHKPCSSWVHVNVKRGFQQIEIVQAHGLPIRRRTDALFSHTSCWTSWRNRRYKIYNRADSKRRQTLNSRCGRLKLLSGMIGSFLAQGYRAIDACRYGVFLHGLSADLAYNKGVSYEAMMPNDIIDNINEAIKSVIN